MDEKKDQTIISTETPIESTEIKQDVIKEVEKSVDVKKLDDDLMSKIANLIDEKFKTLSTPKTSDTTDINKIIEKQVSERLAKMEYDMFINNLKDEDSELIKSIPDYNKLSIQQLKAIVSKTNSLPKMNPKVNNGTQTLDDLVKKAMGLK